MGTNQFLLLILISIITGIAIIGGIQMSQNASEQSQQDELIHAMQPAILAAQAHHQKPAAMGGGGGSFDNFEMPGIRTVDNIRVKQIKKAHPTNHLHFLAYIRASDAVEEDDSDIDSPADVPAGMARVEARIEAGKVEFSETGFAD